MRCPYYESCVTPNWYGKTSHHQFVQEVCLTKEHKSCTSFDSLSVCTTEELQKAKGYIRNHSLYKDKYEE